MQQNMLVTVIKYLCLFSTGMLFDHVLLVTTLLKETFGIIPTVLNYLYEGSHAAMNIPL